MTGEELLEKAIIEVHEETEGKGRFLDPMVLAKLISDILKIFQECPNRERAKRQLRRGGPIVQTAAWRLLRQHDYRGADLWQSAGAMARRGRQFNEAELDLLMEDAQDVPTIPSATGSWFGGLLFVAVMLIPSIAMAGDTGNWFTPDTGVWFPDVVPDVVDQSPVTTPPVAKPAPRRTHPDLDHPHHTNRWTWPGNDRASLLRHLIEDPNHGLKREYLEGLTLQELIAVHNSDHDGFLKNPELRRQASPPRHVAAKPVSYSPPPPQQTGTIQAAHQPAMTTQRVGLFGRRVQMVPVARSGCPAGGCP